MNQTKAIEAFWEWWPSVASAFDTAFRSGAPMSDDLIRQMSERVKAIDPGLDWEFGPGETSQHHLCLSGKGSPELRVIAERWLRNAPKPDSVWSFHAARRASPKGGLRLVIDGHSLELDAVTFELEEDEGRERLDVRAYHPLFEGIDSDDLKHRVTFIALDTSLGEDDVERFVGSVSLADGPSPAAVSLPEFRSRVAELAARATGERWALLKGEIDGAPIFATVNRARKRVDHLLLDTHSAVVITLRDPTDQGLTTNEEAEVLNAMEDELVERLGADALFVARETTRRRRILHFYAIEGGAAASHFDRFRAAHPDYGIRVEVARDPRWENVRHYL